jgi:serine/threonine protein phosphatase PrpC
MLKHSSYVLQASSKQDFAFSGLSSNFTFIGVADEHGKVANAKYPSSYLKKMELSKDLEEEDFFEKIMENTNIVESNGVGSTLCICKIFEDRFEFFWVGDSTGKLYREGKFIWKTKDHDRYNETELERLRKNPDVKIIERNNRGDPILDIIVKNKDTVEMVDAKMYNYKNKNSINFTHSLGHAGITGTHISKEVIIREPDISYKVVCATDGLWAMVCDEDHSFIGDSNNLSKEIVYFANNRWRQSWKQEYQGKEISKEVFFPEYNIDDIGVSVWTN